MPRYVLSAKTITVKTTTNYYYLHNLPCIIVGQAECPVLQPQVVWCAVFHDFSLSNKHILTHADA